MIIEKQHVEHAGYVGGGVYAIDPLRVIVHPGEFHPIAILVGRDDKKSEIGMTIEEVDTLIDSLYRARHRLMGAR